MAWRARFQRKGGHARPPLRIAARLDGMGCHVPTLDPPHALPPVGQDGSTEGSVGYVAPSQRRSACGRGWVAWSAFCQHDGGHAGPPLRIATVWVRLDSMKCHVATLDPPDALPPVGQDGSTEGTVGCVAPSQRRSACRRGWVAWPAFCQHGGGHAGPPLRIAARMDGMGCHVPTLDPPDALPPVGQDGSTNGVYLPMPGILPDPPTTAGSNRRRTRAGFRHSPD